MLVPTGGFLDQGNRKSYGSLWKLKWRKWTLTTEATPPAYGTSGKTWSDSTSSPLESDDLQRTGKYRKYLWFARSYGSQNKWVCHGLPSVSLGSTVLLGGCSSNIFCEHEPENPSEKSIELHKSFRKDERLLFSFFLQLRNISNQGCQPVDISLCFTLLFSFFSHLPCQTQTFAKCRRSANCKKEGCEWRPRSKLLHCQHCQHPHCVWTQRCHHILACKAVSLRKLRGYLLTIQDRKAIASPSLSKPRKMLSWNIENNLKHPKLPKASDTFDSHRQLQSYSCGSDHDIPPGIP